MYQPVGILSIQKTHALRLSRRLFVLDLLVDAAEVVRDARMRGGGGDDLLGGVRAVEDRRGLLESAILGFDYDCA
jgi:hypothetical protein